MNTVTIIVENLNVSE